MIIAMGFALFGVAVKYLPIFPEEGRPTTQRPRSELRPVVATAVLAMREIEPTRSDLGWKRVTHSISAKLIGSLLAVMLVIFALLGYLNSDCTASIWKQPRWPAPSASAT